MEWNLEQGYDVYPRVEEEINDALDRSLEPGEPDQLYDFVAGFDLAPGSAMLDLGCGEGGHTIELAQRFGFAATGIDPVQRHVDVASEEPAGDAQVTFVLGSAEAIPADVYLERYGQEIYDIAMTDNLWHVYAMIGKLHRRAYLLTKP